MSARTHEPRLQEHLEGGPWALIESDPGKAELFLLYSFVQKKRSSSRFYNKENPDTQVVDVYWEFDDKNEWERVGEVYGLIFLFKVSMEIDKSGEEFDDDEELLQVYFANQVIDNACATQALLNIVLNCNQIEIGNDLNQFKNFTRDFKPPLKGLAMTNTNKFRENHNRFVRFEEDLDLVEIEKPKKKNKGGDVEEYWEEEDDDVFHYTGYVPVNGSVFELDGLARNPRKIGEIKGDDWMEVAKDSIRKRLERYQSEGIEYNLMAVVHDLEVYNREKACEKIVIKGTIDRRLNELDPNWNVHNNNINKVSREIPLIKNFEMKALKKPRVTAEIEEIKFMKGINELVEKRSLITQQIRQAMVNEKQARESKEQAKAENERRKFNYVPFIQEFLKILDERDELEEILDRYKYRGEVRE
ncbi:11389_t:CDS:10 [Ambispora gerdemannii]|uniref:ubiquitinyl hydrolase 1 n=1 Tax=Ambispora gerdemannii TaxID=144530 RepID=A0A9N8VZR4_9GLOM|nr:11389_t:CDS:10 [Ambispora gerdemannii]